MDEDAVEATLRFVITADKTVLSDVTVNRFTVEATAAEQRAIAQAAVNAGQVVSLVVIDPGADDQVVYAVSWAPGCDSPT